MAEFWRKIGSAVSQIQDIEISKVPWFLALLDFTHFKMINHRLLLANLLTAASMLIVKAWKPEGTPSIDEWTQKVQYMCLVSKLSALNNYRKGMSQAIIRYTSQRVLFMSSSYANNQFRDRYVLEHVLTVNIGTGSR